MSLSVSGFQSQIWAGILTSASLLLVICGINLPRTLNTIAQGGKAPDMWVKPVRKSSGSRTAGGCSGQWAGQPLPSDRALLSLAGTTKTSRRINFHDPWPTTIFFSCFLAPLVSSGYRMSNRMGGAPGPAGTEGEHGMIMLTLLELGPTDWSSQA